MAEESDFEVVSRLIKELREKRSEKFVDDWLPILKQRYDIIEANHKYTITTEEYGTIDYFPKANKVLIRKDNKWIKPGLNWMINNIIN